MSPYAKLLVLARRQLADAQNGNLEHAIEQLAARQQLLAVAPPATAQDAPLIKEVLRIDRELAGLIRERMLEIRAEALATGRGQTALRGYGSVSVGIPAGVRINSAR